MKNFILPLTALSFAVLTSCGGADKKTEADHMNTADTSHAAMPAADTTATEAAPMDSAAMMKAWQDYMTPGPMHKWMAQSDGKWDAEAVSFMNGQASAPDKVKAENKMILNGLYQESHYKGKMTGMDFEGRGILAYDNARKKFINTWVDNMGSGVLYMEGDYDEASKTLTTEGKSTDPVSGQQSKFKQVIRFTDDKNQLMEMYGEHGGQEVKMLEIRLSRK